MSKVKVDVDHLPSVTLYSISSAQMESRLLAEHQWDWLKLDDGVYNYVHWEDWDKIFLKVMANLKKYVKDAWDCDNFASHIKSECARLFEVNSCARVDGWYNPTAAGIVYTGRPGQRIRLIKNDPTVIARSRMAPGEEAVIGYVEKDPLRIYTRNNQVIIPGTDEYQLRHAWSLFFDGSAHYQLESQIYGAIYDLDDPAYIPDQLIMG